MKMDFKQKIIQALRDEGLYVQQRKMAAAYIKRYGFAARTIVDVGVFRGSQFFYNSFPEANIILVDPLDDAQDVYLRLQKTRNVQLYNCIASNVEGETTLDVTIGGAMSSVEKRSPLTMVKVITQKRVSMKTLDSICEQSNFSGPYGIKIDTEGHELQVMEGVKNHLEQVEFFILEVSVRDRFIGGYRFYDMIKFMYALGFELIDVMSNTPLPRILDCLFVRSSSHLFQQSG